MEYGLIYGIFVVCISSQHWYFQEYVLWSCIMKQSSQSAPIFTLISIPPYLALSNTLTMIRLHNVWLWTNISFLFQELSVKKGEMRKIFFWKFHVFLDVCLRRPVAKKRKRKKKSLSQFDVDLLDIDMSKLDLLPSDDRWFLFKLLWTFFNLFPAKYSISQY